MTREVPDLSLHFGACVKQAREQHGFTQQQLADRLRAYGWKVDTSGITRIENGSRDPRISEAQAIATALGIDLADLVPKSSKDLVAAELRRNLDEARARLIDAAAAYESARDRWSLAVGDEDSADDELLNRASRFADAFAQPGNAWRSEARSLIVELAAEVSRLRA